MAFWDMFLGGRARAVEAAGSASARAAGPEVEPVFVPRGGRALPQNTRAPSVLGAQPHTFARGREVAALLLWTLALFFALALASYAGDPGAHASEGAEGATPLRGEDWVGPVGALVARGAVGLVGVMAWVVPFECLVLGIPFVTGRRSTATATRFAGNVLLVVIGASLVQVGGPTKLAFGAHPAAGMVGELFGEVARSLFSTVGSFLVGFALVGLILIGRASFSFIALMRALARLGRAIAARARAASASIAAAWTKARELERARAEEVREASRPHIAVADQDEATLLVDDGDEDGDDLVALVDDVTSPEALPRVRVARSEDVDGEAPLPLDGVESARTITLDDEPAEPRGRRKRASAPAAAEEPAAVEPAPAPAPKRSRRRASTPPEEVSVEEAIEQALEGEDDDDEEPSAPLAAAPLEPASKRRRSPKPSEPEPEPASPITIIDTSAALEKDAAAPEPPKRERREKKAAPAFELPPLDMLAPAPANIGPMFDEARLRAKADLLVKTLGDYKVTGKVEEILPGPVVTTFEVSPVAGTKVSRVASLADDLALALAKKVRIVAPIPGKNRIGFELPNDKRVPVNLRDLVEDRRFQTLDVPLPVVLGRDIVGNPVYADLASMPHTIVAGATGAGKSVGLNVMLTSLLFRRTPEELRLLMIDPKVVELAPYDRIPHMLLPVVTDMKQASLALKWAVDEMERRYQLFADAGTKNIGTYNAWVKRVRDGEIKSPLGKAVTVKDHNGLEDTVRVRDDAPDGEPVLPEALPMIVIVVDEFADLMMQQGKEVETCVARLAQKARAAGMHVILATQRPSVDVITGMIKANFPTRIAYRVAQKIDSRTILDEQGAEHLLGRGDMLIKLNGTNDTRRVQCPWVSEEEVQEITDFLRAQGEPVYDENILKPRDEDGAAVEDDGEADPMYDEAVRIVAETRRCSTSWLQRKLGLGYNRAARIVETMERRGLVGPANGARDREILIDAI